MHYENSSSQPSVTSLHCIFLDCQHSNTTTSLGNIYPLIPKHCYSRMWKQWFIYKQESSAHTLCCSTFSRAPRGTAWTCIWLTVKALTRKGLGGALYIMETATTQADVIPGRAVTQMHRRFLCMANTYPADFQLTSLPTTPRSNMTAAWCQRK